MIPLAITLAAFASMTSAHALAAQTRSDMVPLEFVEMLSITPFMEDADMAVGRLPDRIASDLAPGPDARIIGSLISTRFSLSALVMQGAPLDVQDRLVTRLLEQGWKRLPEPPARRGGFETEVRERDVSALCSTDDHSLQLTVISHPGDSTVVRLLIGRDDHGVSCTDPELTSRISPEEELPMPPLYAPAGAEYRGGGYSGAYMDGSAQGRVRSDMAPAALLEHYAAQMTAAGWQAGAQTASAEAALQIFRKTDDSRVNWQGVLYVIALPNRERDLYLRVTREQ